MNMAQEERLRIVRYLRDTKAIFDKQQAERSKPLVSRHHAQACEYAANAIERGEHWLVAG